MLDDREVVRDKEVREAEVLLQPLEQVDYLRLDGHVQRGNGLVADYEVRVERQRAGDADALPLAAGELVRILLQVVFVQADLLDELAGAVVDLLLGQQVVFLYGLGEHGEYALGGVQGAVGVLEHHLKALARLVQLLTAEGADVLAVYHYLAGVGLDELHDELAHRGLAAAGLAYEAERLALVYGEGHAVYGLYVADGPPEQALLHGKVFFQVFDFEYRFRHDAASSQRVPLLRLWQAQRWPPPMSFSTGSDLVHSSVK